VFVAIQRSNGAAALREAQLEPNEGYFSNSRSRTMRVGTAPRLTQL
jgi:hypothetical protein